MLTTTVCAALSAAGLAVAFLTAWRRRFVAATRLAAVSLLPVGLAMSGLVGLGGKIGKAVGTWAADLVLKPTVWIGFAVLACAVLLYVIARLAGGRAAASTSPSRKERRAAARTGEQPATEPGANAPSLGSGASKAPATAPAKAEKSPSSSGGGEDFSDIEAILKKHGI